MDTSKALERVPREGFIKLTGVHTELPREQKSALNRKGNLLFNQKKYDLAKKIFLTTGYSDGLIRLGDRYDESGDKLEAFRMYWLAGFRKKTDSMIETMAGIVRTWLQEEQ
jgi:hypothetical protein